MRSFLSEVAADLYGRYGDELSECTVLFPSLRARRFFVDALSGIARRPMWQPSWATVDDLMSELSGLHIGERTRLITELYKVYSEFHNEPFDKFYFWGEMLLSDFDAIDKYLIDAEMLFANIYDIKLIESDISYLTESQLQILRFWSSLGADADLTEEKRRFLAIWKTLLPVYRRFRERLSALGLAYGGMVQRAAVERIDAGEAAFAAPRRYVVAGFNALTECERRLFRFLSTAAQTDFYWDYDNYYVKNDIQEAGASLRRNIAEFPERAAISHDNFLKPKELTSVAAVSNVVQCKYVVKILEELARKGPLDKRTAIVLTDENLLMPLLYALPSDMGRVNVTMGYPLRQSLAYTFVERLIELQNHCRTKGEKTTFYHADVTGLLSHPYLVEGDPALARTLRDQIIRHRRISVDACWLGQNELLKLIFSAPTVAPSAPATPPPAVQPAPSWRPLCDYLLSVLAAVARIPASPDPQRTEFLIAVSEHIRSLANSLDECDIDLTPQIYTSLLRRHLQTIRIPFEGEPLEGVQVMGMLETRNLDFRNVIILSMTDNNFPGNHSSQGSFIPYTPRVAYGLPTPEYHESISAYHFYRLVQRAETVTMLYCSRADEQSTGEPSRYIYQLDYESGMPMRKIDVGVDVNLVDSAPIEVAKDEAIMRRLERFTDADSHATLSPTAFFRYIACPLRFYFHSVAGLEADDEISDEVDAPMFGTILHAAAQQLYERVKGRPPGAILRAMLRTDEVERTVEAAINEKYLQDTGAASDDYSGNLLLVKDVVVRYLRGGVMPYDASHDGFTTTGIEERIDYLFGFHSADRELKVKFSGIADRIDMLSDGTLRVVDYKTGAPYLEFDGLDALFNGTGRQRLSNIVQTLLYSMMLHHTRQTEVEPALYYVRSMSLPGYSAALRDKSPQPQQSPQPLQPAAPPPHVRYSLYRDRFERLVADSLAELYDPSVAFRQCDDADTCKFCDFRVICRR